MDISRAHELLGVTAETPIEEVKKKYRVRSRMMHPDSQQDPLLKDEATDIFRELNEAWDVIQNEERRGTRGQPRTDSVDEALRADQSKAAPHPAAGQQAARAGTAEPEPEDQLHTGKSRDGLYLWLGGPVVILFFGSIGKSFFEMGLEDGSLLGIGFFFVVGALFSLPAVAVVLVMLLMLVMFLLSLVRPRVVAGTAEVVPTHRRGT